MIKNKNGIGSCFLWETGIGYAKTYGNFRAFVGKKYRERSRQERIASLSASSERVTNCVLLKNRISFFKCRRHNGGKPGSLHEVLMVQRSPERGD